MPLHSTVGAHARGLGPHAHASEYRHPPSLHSLRAPYLSSPLPPPSPSHSTNQPTNHPTRRDLKPQNLLVSEGGLLKLADLGISQLLDRVFAKTLIGTPHYMSPEMWRRQPYSYSAGMRVCGWWGSVLHGRMAWLYLPRAASAWRPGRALYAAILPSHARSIPRLLPMLSHPTYPPPTLMCFLCHYCHACLSHPLTGLLRMQTCGRWAALCTSCARSSRSSLQPETRRSKRRRVMGGAGGGARLV